MIYAVECPSLAKVYIGQTKDFNRRIREHKAGHVKKSAHFVGHELVVKELERLPIGPSLNAGEKRWSTWYMAAGWTVVSWNKSARIGFNVSAGERGGKHVPPPGKTHVFTEESLERLKAGARRGRAKLTQEQIVEAGRKGGLSHSKEHLSKAGKLGAASLTPEVRERSVANSFRKYRTCDECGARYNVVHMGKHQRKTGHEGATDVV